MERRQIIPLALCFMLGIFINAFSKNTVIVVILAVITITVIVKSKFRIGLYLILLLFTFFGYMRFGLAEINLENNFDSEIKTLLGTAYGLEEGEYRKYYFLVDKIKTDDGVFEGKHKYVVYTDSTISLNGKLVELKYKPDKSSIKNTGVVSYEEYLKSEGVSKAMFIARQDIIAISENDNLLSWMYDLKLRLLRKLQVYSKNYSIAYGMLLGDKSLIDDEDLLNYKNAGISHILAVSGLHIGLFYVIINFCLARLIRQKRFRALIIMAIMFFIVALNGFSVATLRAYIMIVLLLTADLIHQEYDSMNIIFFVLFLNLMINPMVVYSLGAHFSYVVTLSIIIFYKKLYKAVVKVLGEYLSSITCLSISATIGVAVVSLTHFNYLSISGFLYNVLLINIFFVQLLMIIFILINPIALFNHLVGGLVDISFLLIGNFLEVTIPLLGFKVYFTNLEIQMTAFILSMIAFRKRFRILEILTVSFVLLAVLIYNYNSLKISFFDVGHGDSTLISNRNYSILIDAGDGKTDIATLLLKNNVKHLDYLIVSHKHLDHNGGVPDIIERLKVARVIDANDMLEYIELDDLKIHNSIRFMEDENNNSIVTEISCKGFDLLLLGDAEKEREVILSEELDSKEFDMVKIGHHGSKTSSCTEFLDEFSFKFGIISLDKYDRYKYNDNLDKIENYMTIFETSQFGEIRVVTDMFENTFISTSKSSIF